MLKNYSSTYKLVKIPSKIENMKVTNSSTMYSFVRKFFHEDIEIYESFFIALLNRNNVTTGWVKISQGGISGTVVDVKLICKYAIENLASAVICVHNHPSGCLTPSRSDTEITEKIKGALGYFEIKLLDHLIIVDGAYFSFADEGLL